jgi:hypothetical protein
MDYMNDYLIIFDNVLKKVLLKIYLRMNSILFSKFSIDFCFSIRYFQENWAVALYHDRFTDVRNEVREILKKAMVFNL